MTPLGHGLSATSESFPKPERQEQRSPADRSGVSLEPTPPVLGYLKGGGLSRRLESIFFAMSVLAWIARIAAEGGAARASVALAAGLAAVAAIAAVFIRGGGPSPRWLDGPRLILAVVVLYCLPQVYGRVGGDGVQYYLLLRSPLLDADFNFANDYAGMGIPPFLSREGIPTNRYPIGVPLFWLPTVALTHLVLSSSAFIGHPLATPDGFSPPYQAAATTTTFVLSVAALALLEAEIRRRHGRSAALLAVLAIWLATPLDFYLTANPSMSHGASMVGATLLVLSWLRARSMDSLGAWSWVGLFGALTCLVRAQDALLMILPLGDIALGVRVPRVPTLLRLAIWPAVLGTVQLLVFLTIHGTGFLGELLGYSLLDHPSPHPVEFLFAARHGLFTWTPLYLPAVAGFLLFRRGQRRVGALSMLTFLAAVAVNSSMADWWGSDSFGQRRMLSLTPLFALGLGETLAWARRHPFALPSSCLALLALWNTQFSYIYNGDWLGGKDQAVSLEQLAATQVEVAALEVLRYADRLPRSVFVLLHDNLRGLWLDEGPRSLGGVIDLGATTLPFPIVGPGWSRPMKEGKVAFRYSKGLRSLISVPVMTPGDFDVFLTIKAAFEAVPPVVVRLEAGGEIAGEAPLVTEWREISFSLPERLLLPGINQIALDYSTTPSDIGPDFVGRNAAVAVQSIRFVRRRAGGD